MLSLSLATLDPNGSELERQLLLERDKLTHHVLFEGLASIDRMRDFMRYHVWCVWDFMALLKSVQIGVGRYSVAWTPPDDNEALSIVQSIVAQEETDLDAQGKRVSHFEAYLDAMRELDCDTSQPDAFITQLRLDVPPIEAMRIAGAPECSIAFVSTTLGFAESDLHRRAAALTLGREELVPELLRQIRPHDWYRDPKARRLRWYIDRHIELDVSSHGPDAVRLLALLIGQSSERRRESLETALAALRARREFLDAIHRELSALSVTTGGVLASA